MIPRRESILCACLVEFYSDLKGIDISAIVLCRRLLLKMCIGEGSLALDTPQNKSRSRLLFRAYDKQTNKVDANLGSDWPQTLIRGYQFTFIYTTKSFVLSTLSDHERMNF